MFHPSSLFFLLLAQAIHSGHIYPTCFINGQFVRHISPLLTYGPFDSGMVCICPPLYGGSILYAHKYPLLRVGPSYPFVLSRMTLDPSSISAFCDFDDSLAIDFRRPPLEPASASAALKVPARLLAVGCFLVFLL